MSDETKTQANSEVASIDWLGILTYVVNECQKSPSNSVKDIVNEALDDYCAPYFAEWSDDDLKPIDIIPNDSSEPCRK